MATLHLMCGLPGSGKTVRARHLESTLGAVRLSASEWIADLGHDPADSKMRTRVERLQRRTAFQLLAAGRDVIVEHSLWTRRERMLILIAGHAAGHHVTLHYWAVDPETLRAHVERRNLEVAAGTAAPGTSHIDLAQLEAWAAMFEPPDATELARFDDPGTTTDTGTVGRTGAVSAQPVVDADAAEAGFASLMHHLTATSEAAEIDLAHIVAVIDPYTGDITAHGPFPGPADAAGWAQQHQLSVTDSEYPEPPAAILLPLYRAG